MSKYSNEFKLEALLKYAEVARSTFYYPLNRLKEPDNTNLILHSDQGWQYQMNQY